MTYAELQMIEEELGFELPPFYKTTMAADPFPREHGEGEPMLIDNPHEVVDLNRGGLEMAGVGCAFFVGSDGGEKLFFVDAMEPMSPVYCSDGETGYHRIQAWSWGKYMAQVHLSRRERQAGPVAAGGGKWSAILRCLPFTV
jgi:hypothetical protein